MVAPSEPAETTAVVSIHEEKNTEVEIPRYDPRDKRKLWISKIEIHHNTMMEKIRGLVQEKLLEQVVSNDDFFAGIEDVTIEIDDDGEGQNQRKLETEEDILLAKKAQMLQDLLSAIMELDKEEILSFLTSSSLPAGLNMSTKKSPAKRLEPAEPETSENSSGDTGGSDTTNTTNGASDARAIDDQNVDNNTNEENQEQQQQQKEDQNHYGYNWILDCGDAWRDLPAVVRINAMELGYNETLWDQDTQDLPVFRTLWKKLTSNQHTAAIFLGNYDEPSWNDDVRILLLSEENPSLSSIADDETSSQEVDPIAVETPPSTDNPKIDQKEDATVATTVTEMSDDDGDIFSEFVSNFAADTNEEREEANKADIAEQRNGNVRYDNEEENTIMDEFLSNFGVSAEDNTDTTSANEKNSENERSDKINNIFQKNNEDEEIMMDEFLSNFVDSPNEADTNTDSGNECSPETEISARTVSVISENEEEDDEGAMMDEFLSNFVDSAKQEEDGTDSSKEQSSEMQNLIPATDGFDSKKKEDNNNNDDSEMMDEFLANFGLPNEGGGGDGTDGDNDDHRLENDSLLMVPSESLVPNYESVRENVPDNDEKEDEEEQPLVSKPRESIMERGYLAENSPLLPSNQRTNSNDNDQPQAQKPDPSSSTWDTVSSYLYWIPVIIGLPVVYIMANRANAPNS